MYKNFFPQSLDPNWMLSDDDPDNRYIELLGYDREFLISISFEPDENESKPYFLNFQQMKGSFLRYDYPYFVKLRKEVKNWQRTASLLIFTSAKY